ncbi:MAG TPA: aromatic aminobenezylarsenical efflux permease ArsG family transporter [Candidatus Omnitrophota bacterium]|nr:aromatic aminobenezylarsenical efflux permease ArsG family transporter [Candidatus Omnitrophota bacterium]
MEVFVACGSALWFGILTSISPCPLATNIAAVSFLSKKIAHPVMVFLSGLSYTLGRMAAYAALGWFIVNSLLNVPQAARFLQTYMPRAMGPLLILTGLFLLEVLSVKLPGVALSHTQHNKLVESGAPGAFILGFIFALAFCPVSAALFFGSLIPLALNSRAGTLLAFVYGVGTGLPVLVLAVAIALGLTSLSHWFHRLARIEYYTRRITGGIFILVGIYYLWSYFPLSVVHAAQANSLKSDSDAPVSRIIAINAPVELDYKTKAEIYALRKSLVAMHREMISGEYQPSEAVFGQIEDKKPWWGITGQFCKGDGQHSIDGVSEEARFILNPFLLLAVDETQSWKLDGSCTPAYPRPVSLQWFARERRAVATYAMTEFFRQRIADGFPSNGVQGSTLSLNNLNARDFGYEFLHLDAFRSRNINRVDNAGMFADSVQLSGFLHRGGSCGYPGGCNNGSPREPDLHFTVNKLPATLCCKLWKIKPSSYQAEADFTFVIDLK